MKNLITNVVDEKELRIAQLRALELFSRVVGKTYGPLGGYSAYSKQDANNKAIVSYYSKDGFTILKNIECDMPIESILREEIRDICTEVIKEVGDGTSSAVIMSHLIFKGMLALHKKGHKKRDIIKAFRKVTEDISKNIIAKAREADLDDIYDIALTSLNGNEEMAKMIRDIYDYHGMRVFIDVQGNSTKNTVIKSYDGMIYDSGYLDPCFINNANSTCELEQPHIYVFDNPVDTPAMINVFHMIVKAEIENPNLKLRQMSENGTLQKMIEKGKQPDMPAHTIIFAPYFSRDANSYLDQIISSFNSLPPERRYGLCIVQMGNADPNKLIDIAKLTGAKFIKKYIDSETFKQDQLRGLAPTEMNIKTFAGTADKIIVDKLETKIINPAKMKDADGNYTDYFNNYIDALDDQLQKLQETNQEVVEIGKLKRRINILTGNMVDLYIGGIGTSDKKSLTDSVEDAVLNCRSAARDGVGFAAGYDGLIESYKYYKNLDRYEDETVKAVAGLVFTAYHQMTVKLYTSAFEDEKKARELTNIIVKKQDNNDGIEPGPYNIVTGDYDRKIKTSIKTEPAILESIRRIISIIFDTNQFLVPSPQFNIYTMENSTMVINQAGVSERVEDGDKVDEDFEILEV